MSTMKLASLPVPIRSAPSGKLTEAEFIEWCDGDTWAEWVDGKVNLLNAVTSGHNDMFVFLVKLIGGFVEAHELGEVMAEPFQIRLPLQSRRRSPDLFYASTGKVHLKEEMQFNGAPDLIIEIVSPGSQTEDRESKFREYESAGVREYWLIDPPMRGFDAYSLGSDFKYARLPVQDGTTFSAVLHGLYFRSEWVWQLKLPKVPPLLQDMSERRSK
jgi:Uma2 family endonuclease